MAYKTERIPRRQNGAILAVSLVVLLALTLLALAASQSSRSHERVALELEMEDRSLQAAEAALRAGERSVYAAIAPCSETRCAIYPAFAQEPGLLPREEWEAYSWPYSSEVDPAGRTGARFLVEQLPAISDSLTIPANGQPRGLAYYRITAIAYAAERRTVLQSTFSRRLQ